MTFNFAKLGRLGLAALGVAASAPASASASSSSAWDEFRHDVEAACRSAAEDQVAIQDIMVDPFGSEKYGLAFISIRSDDKAPAKGVICVYDKASHSVEIGGELALQPSPVEPKP